MGLKNRLMIYKHTEHQLIHYWCRIMKNLTRLYLSIEILKLCHCSRHQKAVHSKNWRLNFGNADVAMTWIPPYPTCSYDHRTCGEGYEMLQSNHPIVFCLQKWWVPSPPNDLYMMDASGHLVFSSWSIGHQTCPANSRIGHVLDYSREITSLEDISSWKPYQKSSECGQSTSNRPSPQHQDLGGC